MAVNLGLPSKIQPRFYVLYLKSPEKSKVILACETGPFPMGPHQTPAGSFMPHNYRSELTIPERFIIIL
jgi:hypothetical protein